MSVKSGVASPSKEVVASGQLTNNLSGRCLVTPTAFLHQQLHPLSSPLASSLLTTTTPNHPQPGVFIGEAAHTMIQNVDYEVPYLRKAMAKCSQQMADAERRHGEYVRGAAQCAANYKKVRDCGRAKRGQQKRK